VSGPIEAPTLLLLAGVMLFVLTLFRVGRRNRPVPQKGLTSPAKPQGPNLTVARVADDLEVKLYNTFRELNARLENKIHVLNDLVTESEAKIRRLEQLAEKNRAANSPAIINIEPSSNSSTAPPSERFAEIYQMADRGMTPTEISQRVDQPIGEVQLILGLRKRRKSG
jgi:hypothetical protein